MAAKAFSRAHTTPTDHRTGFVTYWLIPFAVLVVATLALVSDGALFTETSQLVAAAVILSLGLVTVTRRWERVCAIANSRLGLLAVVEGLVLLISGALSVYHWVSVRELLKAAALAEMFLLGMTVFNSDAARDRLLVLSYWWSVAMAGMGCMLYAAGMRWPHSWLGSYAVRMLATAANRLSSFFGYANAFAAFMLVPMALGVALAWRAGRRGTAALAGLVVPLIGMQLAASRWGYVVLGMVLVAMLVVGPHLVTRGGYGRTRAAVVTGLVLVLAIASMLVPAPAVSPSHDVGTRFTDISAEIRNTGPEMSSIGGRIAMVRDALRYSAAYPVFGSGPGTYASTYFRFRSTNFFAADPHSLAMLWLTETGGVGLAAQVLLVVAALALMWLAAARDAARNPLMVGAAFGITGVVAHAMLDWDFQSFFLPLMVALFCGAAVSVLVHGDSWLLGSWSHPRASDRAESRRAVRRPASLRPLAIVGMSLCIVTALTAVSAARVAAVGSTFFGTDPARAVRLFKTAQRINPLDAQYPYLYAKTNVALAANGSDPSVDQAARDGFDRAIALNPWHVQFQIDQARYLLSRGDTACIAVYENLTRIDPGDPGTFTSLAWAYHLLYRNDEKALQTLDQAFSINKAYYEAWLVTGRIQEARGQTAEAIAAYWKAANANQGDAQAPALLGGLYDQTGNAAGVARAAFELLQRTPESASAKSVFSAFGLGIGLDAAAIEGGQAKVAWKTVGKQVAEYYRLVLVRPNSEDAILMDRISPLETTAEAPMPQAILGGPCRLRLYAMAPIALAGLEGPWVAWAESGELLLEAP